MAITEMSSLDLNNQRVLMRLDLNVPIKDGKVSSDKRIRAVLPGLKLALEQGGRVLAMSHLGRPTEGQPDNALSLAPVAEHLGELLGQPVRLITDYLAQAPVVDPGEVVLLENVRFNTGEKANDEALSRQYAKLCDIFVMDAFGTAHRAQASTYGVGEYAPVACSGPLLTGELKALSQAMDNPARPLVALVGGSKVSTKLTVLESLSTVVDKLIVGGGIANTFIAADGHNVGKSLYEEDLVPVARSLKVAASEAGGDIPVPTDVVCGKEFSEISAAATMAVTEVSDDDMIFDIGPQTAEVLADIIRNAGTIVWNGPVGVFEFDQFGNGTKTIANAIAESKAFSVAGGGDTLAAVDKYDIADKVSYISTGGGSFLEFLEGKKLPVLNMLEKQGDK